MARSPFAFWAAVALCVWSGPALPAQQGPLDRDQVLTFRQQFELHQADAERAERAQDLPALSEALSYVCDLNALVHFQTADAVCARAEKIARGLGRRDLVAFAVGMRADALAWLGQFERSRELSLAALAENPPPDTATLAPRAMILELLGTLAYEMGEPDESLRYLEASEAEAKRVGWKSQVGWVGAGRVRLFTFLGDEATARKELDRAEAIAHETGDANLEAILLWLGGAWEDKFGRPEAAIRSFDRCTDLTAHLEFTLIWATCLSEKAESLISLRRLEEAERHVEAADRGLAAAGVPLTDALSVSRGEVARLQGRYGDAVRQFDATLKLRPHIALSALRGKARALATVGDLDGAIAALEQAVSILETTRARVGAGEMRSGYFESRADIYRRLFGAVFDRGSETSGPRLFEISEALRARALLDRLNTAGVGPIDPAFAHGRLGDVLARLEPGDVLIECVESDDRLFALTLDRHGLAVTLLKAAGGATRLRERVSFFRELVMSAGSASHILPAAQSLFRDLVQPALDSRKDRSPLLRLFLATDGPLGALPFEGLADGDGQFLGIGLPVIRVPSAAWLASRSRPQAAAQPRAVVLANPESNARSAGRTRGPELPALPFSRDEAQVIARVWPGSDVLEGRAATKRAVRERLSGAFGVLHFATHAVEDTGLPLRSFLQVAMSSDAVEFDGFLRAEEIYERRVAIPLVVLSACDSAHGRFRSGEGELSLGRAFLHAGATTVVGALLPVEDEGSAQFFRHFYEELGEGVTVESALQTARRVGVEALRPRVWAAFAMSGAPGLRFARVPQPAAPGWARTALLSVMAVIGLLGASRVRSRRGLR